MPFIKFMLLMICCISFEFFHSSATLVQIEHVHGAVGLNKRDVRITSHLFDHKLRSFNLSHSYETGSILCNGIGNESSGLSICFGSDNRCACLFLLLLNYEFCSLGYLLSNLFLLDGISEFSWELQVGDRNVIQKESEFCSSPRKLFSNILRYLFSLRDQLASVILGDYGFKYLIADRWQNFISIILTDIVNNLCNLLLLGPEQDSEGQVDVLEVSGTCLRTKESWLRSNLDVLGLINER